MLAAALRGYSPSYEQLTQQRAERAEKAKGDIVVAIVWQTQRREDLFEKGIGMAVEEINRRGGVLGRRLRALRYNVSTGEKALQLAKKLSRNPDIVAVIGHGDSDEAIPASIVYEESGLLFISPGATSPLLTSHGFQYVFRNIPSDRQTGRDLAEFANASGYRNVASVDDQSSYGQLLAESFVEHAQKIGIEIKGMMSYYPWQNDFRLLIADIKSMHVDAIFLGAHLPMGAEVIRQAREMGVMVPILAGDGLDSPSLWKIAGKAAEGTIISSVFNPDVKDEIARTFSRNFYARYSCYPDTWAAQGYDAMRLLSYAFAEAKSTIPLVVSSYLHFIASWHGVTGSYSFTDCGDIMGKEMYFKVVRNGGFQYLDSFHKGGE